MAPTAENNKDDRRDEINVIVMSEAGKPIFFRWGNDEQVTKMCGLVSAIRTSVLDSDALGLGDLQSLQSEELTVVFMTVGSIILIATSRRGKYGECETEAYLRLQLEYVYGHIVFTLTEKVQDVFQQNPGFDLGNMLGSNDSAMLGILDEAGPLGNCGSLFAGAIETVFPIDPSVRDDVSTAVAAVGNATPNTVFAILIAGNKLLTLVQPKYRPHQLRTSDLHLILNFVNHQPGLLTSELWVPVCLPRFNSSGFLYAYTNCLDKETKLSIILMSQHSTTEQFELFRKAATSIRKELGLPALIGSVLHILETNSDEQETSGARDDVAWSRSDAIAEQESDDEDYVDASGNGDRIIPSVNKYVPGEPCPLLRDLQNAANVSVRQSLLEDYCKVSSAMHFVFRLDVPVRGNKPKRNETAGALTQCISAPLGSPFQSTESKRRIWTMYQKLNLRLRLGSASVESTMDAFDMIANDHINGEEEKLGSISGIGRHCPAICLAESPPNIQGITYVLNGDELFMALNGRDFEL